MLKVTKTLLVQQSWSDMADLLYQEWGFRVLVKQGVPRFKIENQLDSVGKIKNFNEWRQFLYGEHEIEIIFELATERTAIWVGFDNRQKIAEWEKPILIVKKTSGALTDYMWLRYSEQE